MIKTTSIESGARLEALGVTVPSYFSWEDYRGWRIIRTEDATESVIETVPAYLSGELGEMLPWIIGEYYLETSKVGGGFGVCFKTKGKEAQFLGDILFHYGDTEADARALMLIWLIEKGHVTVEEINKGEG